MVGLRRAALGAALTLLITAPAASAAGGPARGFLPPNARPLGHSLVDLATAWTVWGFGNGEDNPLLDPRCEESSDYPGVWFLPVGLGGEEEVECDVPQGASLLMFAGGAECSDAEDPPWHGGNEAELIECVDLNFEDITYQEISVDGATTANPSAYAIRTRMVTLPAPNLLSDDETISMTKGFFAVVPPLSRGTHTLGNYTEFGEDFAGGLSYSITVH